MSANKGAAAMAETVIQRMPAHVGECEFALLTTYPKDDEGRLPADANARIVGFEPLRLALVEFPVALIAFIARLIKLPLGWVRARGCRAMLDSDVVVDVAGISFASGRGIPILVYNALMTGTPLLLGVPTVKAAQALGSFDGRVNRILARIVLPHLEAVCARGQRTRDHLNGLGLSNVVDVADLAFSLEESATLPAYLSDEVARAREGYVVVMPSSVVRSIVNKSGNVSGADGVDPYLSAMVSLVKRLRVATGRSVVVAPHSYRVGQPEGRMNDGPVCREVVSQCTDDAGVVGIDADLSAGELRHLIAGASVLVTSRFHAMISGLSTRTPTVVVGWSHKYREVLDDFGLVELGMDASSLSDVEAVVGKVVDVLGRRDEIVQKIESALPSVKMRSEKNFEVVASVVAGATRGGRR